MKWSNARFWCAIFGLERVRLLVHTPDRRVSCKRKRTGGGTEAMENGTIQTNPWLSSSSEQLDGIDNYDNESRGKVRYGTEKSEGVISKGR